jgi:hypothetical protein
MYSIFAKSPLQISDTLVNTIGLLAFGLLGLTSVDRYTKLKQKISKKYDDAVSDQ